MTMVTVAESLVCPPPPSDSALNEEAISSLIVPAPKWNKVRIWLMMVIGHTYHLYMENIVSCQLYNAIVSYYDYFIWYDGHYFVSEITHHLSRKISRGANCGYEQF